MSQYIINIGAAPNDGTGDPLRSAFNDVNVNFEQVFAAGPVDSNIRIANNSILVTNTNGELVLSPNGIGNIVITSSIVPDYGNIRDIGSQANHVRSVYAGYFVGDGSLLTNLNGANITGTYGNANVADYLPTYSGEFNNVTIRTAINNYQDANGNPVALGNGNISINNQPAGANTQIQFNSGTGNFAATGNLTFNSTTNLLNVGGNIHTTTLYTGAVIPGIIDPTVGIVVNNGASPSLVVGDWDTANTAPHAYVKLNAFKGANSALISTDAAQLELVNSGIQGNIMLSTGYLGDKTWYFDYTGNIVTPEGGIVGDPYGDGGTGIQSRVNGYAILASNNLQQFVQSDDSVVYIGTAYPQITNIWTFDKVGNLTLPQPVTNAVTSVSINPGPTVGYTTATNVPTDATTGIGSGLTVDIVVNLAGNITSAVINNPGTGYAVGDQIQIDQVGSTGTGELTIVSVGNITPSINYANGVPFGGVGDGTSINNGTSSVSIPTADGNIEFTYNTIPSGSITSTTVALGVYAGQINMGAGAVALGASAGQSNQGAQSIAIGTSAGNLTQGIDAVAIGAYAGGNTQGSQSVAIGNSAGATLQGTQSVAIGFNAGESLQGANTVAIGTQAGRSQQQPGAIAIGANTAVNLQGNNSIAIGSNIAGNVQPDNSIMLVATGVDPEATNSGFYVAPIRNDFANTTNAVYYNTLTKELTYGPGGSGSVITDLIPAANVTYSLGNATNQWASLWVSANTIYIGGQAIGVTGNALTVNGSDVIVANTSQNTDITTTGNVTAGYFIGDGSQLTNLPAGNYSNSNVAAYLPTYTGNLSNVTISTDNYFYANGAPFSGGGSGTGNSLVNGNANVFLDSDGVLNLPVGHGYVYDVPLVGFGSGAEIHFELNSDLSGTSTEWMAGVTAPGTGYAIGDEYTFDSTFLQIPGASVTITVAGINGSGGVTDVAFTPPPLYPTSLYRQSGFIALQADTNRWTFGLNGNLTLPTNTSSINYANGQPYGGGSSNVDLGNVAQNILPTANTTYNIGNLTNQWNSVYANTFVIPNMGSIVTDSGYNVLAANINIDGGNAFVSYNTTDVIIDGGFA